MKNWLAQCDFDNYLQAKYSEQKCSHPNQNTCN